MAVGGAGIEAEIEPFRVDAQDGQGGLLAGFGLQGELRILKPRFQGIPAGGFRQGRIGPGTGVRCRGLFRERQGAGGCRRQDVILGGQGRQTGQTGKVELLQLQGGGRGRGRGAPFGSGSPGAAEQQAEQQAERTEAAGETVLPSAAGPAGGQEGGGAKKNGCDRSVHTC